MPRFPRLRLLVPAAILASALVLTACPGESATPTPIPPPPLPAARSPEILVEMTSFDFIPEDFEFSVGETVEFELYSRDIEHDFNVEALGIDWDVNGEETGDAPLHLQHRGQVPPALHHPRPRSRRHDRRDRRPLRPPFLPCRSES